MFNYFLKRATIAINQRKSWFFIPIVMTIFTIAWLYFSSPAKYVISATYTPPVQNLSIQQAEGITLDEVQLWNMALQELGIGSQFIANKIQQGSERVMSLMPSLINEWAKTKNTKEKQGIPRRDRGFKREIIRHIISFVTMDKVQEINSKFSTIEFVYRGDKKALGVKLIEFYSQELLDPWREDIMKKKSRVGSKVGYLIDRMEMDATPATQKKLNEYQVQVKNYDAMLTLLKGNPSAIIIEELDRELSDAIMAQSFYLLILLAFITLLVIMVVEFTGKTFTTEYQVSQYLGIKLIGTIPEVKSFAEFRK